MIDAQEFLFQRLETIILEILSKNLMKKQQGKTLLYIGNEQPKP